MTSVGIITGVITLRGVEGVGSMGCGVGGGLKSRCSMVLISTYALEVMPPYVREGRSEDLFLRMVTISFAAWRR